MSAGRRPGASGAGASSRAGARPGTGARTGTRPAASVAGRPARRAAGQRPTRLRRLTVLGGVLVVLAVLLAPALRAYVGQQRELQELQSTVAQQRQTLNELDRRRQAWEDPAFVKAQARDRLKFVMPGEKAYTVIDPAPAPSASTSSVRTAVRVARTDRAWFGNLWNSVEVAGSAPVPRR